MPLERFVRLGHTWNTLLIGYRGLIAMVFVILCKGKGFRRTVQVHNGSQKKGGEKEKA